jgi:hypothetical protein
MVVPPLHPKGREKLYYVWCTPLTNARGELINKILALKINLS